MNKKEIRIFSNYFGREVPKALWNLGDKSEREYEKVFELMEEFGLENGFMQEFESESYYRPDFNDRTEPFKR